jgi:hypothetical protein
MSTVEPVCCLALGKLWKKIIFFVRLGPDYSQGGVGGRRAMFSARRTVDLPIDDGHIETNSGHSFDRHTRFVQHEAS